MASALERIHAIDLAGIDDVNNLSSQFPPAIIAHANIETVCGVHDLNIIEH